MDVAHPRRQKRGSPRWGVQAQRSGILNRCRTDVGGLIGMGGVQEAFLENAPVRFGFSNVATVHPRQHVDPVRHPHPLEMLVALLASRNDAAAFPL